MPREDKSPLTEEENAEPARELVSPLTEEEKAIVEENAGLIGVAIKVLGIKYIPKDDQDQIGAIALMSAVRGFDESYGTQFSTYAVKAICNTLLRCEIPTGAIRVPAYLRSSKNKDSVHQEDARRARRASSMEPILKSKHHPASREENKPGLERQDADDVRDAVEKLKPIERDVIHSIAFGGESLKSVGERHGLPRDSVRRIKSMAFAKLRVSLQKYA